MQVLGHTEITMPGSAMQSACLKRTGRSYHAEAADAHSASTHAAAMHVMSPAIVCSEFRTRA